MPDHDDIPEADEPERTPATRRFRLRGCRFFEFSGRPEMETR